MDLRVGNDLANLLHELYAVEQENIDLNRLHKGSVNGVVSNTNGWLNWLLISLLRSVTFKEKDFRVAGDS